MNATPRRWVVEAQVVLRNPWRASEQSRRDFFVATRSIETRGTSSPEVGWTGDDMVFVAITCEALTAEDAAAAVTETIKQHATSGARWRLSTGLTVTIVGVQPLKQSESA